MHTHILVIDANQDLLDMFADLLEYEGFSTTTQLLSACSMEDIITMTPDLIIMDYAACYGRPAYTLIQQIHHIPRPHAIPMLVCTADSAIQANHAQWFSSHMIPIMHKPFDITTLFAVIRKIQLQHA